MEFLRNSLKKLPQISNKLINYNKNINVGLINKFSTESQSQVTENEILGILKKNYPQASNISVQDVSGGCGAMFNIFIETKEFIGLSIVKQHRQVYDILNKQIKNIHGLHLETKIPN